VDNVKKMTNPTVGILRLLFLIPAIGIFQYMTLYTKYTPDTYVFVQYAYRDNLTRSIDIDSLLNNNVIFDLLTIVGDILNIDTPLGWTYLILFFAIIVFSVKYSYLLLNYDLLAVVIIYFASFFVDLNQLRFSISSIFLYCIARGVYSKYQVVFFVFGFSSHIIPFFIYSLQIMRRKIVWAVVGAAPFIFFLILSGFGRYLVDSRLFSYFSLSIGQYPKVLLLFSPLSVYFLRSRPESLIESEVLLYAKSAFIIGISLFLFNYELTARFFEISFIAVCVANALSKRIFPIDAMLLITSITIFVSRMLSGITTQTDFSEQYLQVW
jgi:hypothetical protein